MAVLTFTLLFSFFGIIVLAKLETQEVEVKPGKDATLPCRGHRGAAITVLRWTRADLKSDEYVFYFRDGHLSENHQHPSYRGRVELRDPEMKHGDASVILKNVTVNDAGTYQCSVRKEHGSELFSIIWLTVTGTLEVKVKPGEDATLPCRGHRGAAITVLRWTRADRKPDDGYVFYFRDGRLSENHQYPSFRGRVELRDPEMKDGDASVILKNVNINDAGTYRCSVREEHGSELFSTMRLTVTEPQEVNVTLNAGEDATLPCRVPWYYMKSALVWMRTEPWLKPLLYFRVNVSFENRQHPSYRGRVELRDPELKDGYASVILKNVTVNDAGTYLCDWVGVRCFGSGSTYDPFSIIVLTVTGHTAGHEEREDEDRGKMDEGIKDRGKMDEGKKDRGNKDERKAEGNRSFLHSREHVGLLVDLLLGALLVAVVVVAVVVFRFIICRKYKVLTEINSY